MTEDTAKKVFDILLYEIRSQGFTDIGTFMLDEVKKKYEYEEFDEKYEYIDSDKVIALIEIESASPQGAKIALRKLVNASIEYFNLAYQIPEKYEKAINAINNENESTEINLEKINGETVNVSDLVRNELVSELIDLLEKIKKGYELDDETFLNSI